MLKEFREFIAKGNLVEIAVAFIMGLAFAAVVSTFTNMVLGAIAYVFGASLSFSELGVHKGEVLVIPIGAFILGLSTLPFLWNVFKSWRYGEVVTVDDPWGYGNSLEWATSCPPPRHNFTELPRIRSERPAFELHYPHMVERMRAEAHVGRSHGPDDGDVTRLDDADVRS